MFPSFREWLTAAEADTTLHHTTPPTQPPASAQLPVLVVGAGPGGLCVMAELLRRSVSCVCIEQHTGVGGIWDITSTHSPMYDGLICNGSRYSMTLDKPLDMPSDGPLFPTNRTILAYLNTYADKHSIRQHCRFGCRAEQAVFDEAQQCWNVRYKVVASGEERTEQFTDVIAASGLNGRSSAHIPPELLAQCKAAQIPFCHSSAIKQPASYANKRVLVVGLGISGSDMAAQLSRHAEVVYVSVRTAQYVTPTLVYGQPLDRIAGGDLPNVAALPRWLANAALWAGSGLLHRVEAGMTKSWMKFGMKRPTHGVSDKLPISDDGSFFEAVQQGRVVLRNEVQSFDASKVHYVTENRAVENNVESDNIDAVVFGTGYRFLHLYLPQTLTPQLCRPVHIPTGRYPDVGTITPHTQTINTTFLLFSPHNTHLYYMTEVQAGFDWPVFQQQAKAIVSVLQARRQQSDRIRRFDRVIAFPNIAFNGPLLSGSHVFRPNDAMVVEKGLYTQFLKQFVSWVESDSTAVTSGESRGRWW